MVLVCLVLRVGGDGVAVLCFPLRVGVSCFLFRVGVGVLCFHFVLGVGDAVLVLGDAVFGRNVELTAQQR